MDPNRIRAAIDGIYDEIIALRRDIHMHPELSQQEERTMHVISDRLAALNIPHETNVAGYGVVATIGSPSAKYAIGIRADIDALPIQEENDVPYASKVPGVMHACGHDVHTAILLGAAQILKSMEAELPGRSEALFPAGRGNGWRRARNDRTWLPEKSPRHTRDEPPCGSELRNRQGACLQRKDERFHNGAFHHRERRLLPRRAP